MSKVSTARKLGAAVRVASQQAGRSRTVRAAKQAASTTLRVFARALHQLWLEVVGAVFLLMALSFAGGVFREYGKYRAGQGDASRVAVVLLIAGTFAWFGVSSFWRARKKNPK